MRHSKMFLGLTAATFAVAGTAATRIFRATTRTVYCINALDVCPLSAAKKCTSVRSKTGSTINGMQVYKDSPCNIPAYYHTN